MLRHILQDNAPLPRLPIRQIYILPPNKKIDKKFSAYSSGILLSSTTSEEYSIFTFEQKIPIPSYLFALIAGDEQEKKISTRCSVVAEP